MENKKVVRLTEAQLKKVMENTIARYKQVNESAEITQEQMNEEMGLGESTGSPEIDQALKALEGLDPVALKAIYAAAMAAGAGFAKVVYTAFKNSKENGMRGLGGGLY